MKQQSRLTCFLRTVPVAGAARKPVVQTDSATTNRSASMSGGGSDAGGEADLPWPEVELTGTGTPATTAPAVGSSTYTPLLTKRKPPADHPPDAALMSPSKRVRPEETTKSTPPPASSAGLAKAQASSSDSLEDIEEFSSESQGDGSDSARKQPGPTTGAAGVMHPFFARGGRGKRLGREFYEHDCESLAKMLLGQLLVRVTADNQRCVGGFRKSQATVCLERELTCICVSW